jgi:4'-phosphopantetheinyl transferase
MDDGVVEVWRADLTVADDGVTALLSSEEAARAARFAREADGLRWARARGILRALLGDYLGADPRSLRIETDGDGKPRVAGPLEFNLSHSAGVALYAFAAGRSVGVDVEVARERRTDPVALAARAFGPEEAARLAALDPAQRQAEFLRAWARYEARLKCGAESPWIVELDVGPGAAAALAVERGPCAVRRREWPTTPRSSG